MNRIKVHSAALLFAAAALLVSIAPAPAAAATPAQAPSQVTGTAGSGSATVRWAAPATVNGAPVQSFTVTASSGQTMTADQPNTWAIVAGLTNGRPVTFTVTATSAAGTSTASAASAAVAPEPVAPP